MSRQQHDALTTVMLGFAPGIPEFVSGHVDVVDDRDTPGHDT